jgi:hypothetical protein
MASSSPIQPIKVAIYFDLVAGRSARETAARFNMSHPTAVKYADEALVVLRTLPEVVTNPELSAYMGDSVKKQAFGFTPAIREMLAQALQPFLDQAAEAVVPNNSEPTLTISAKVPETDFYQFKRLVAAEAKERGTDLTISALLAELISIYVSTGVPPVSKAKFQQSDLLMDDLRQVLAKHGIINP